jgi:hypothetical protein
VTGKPLFYRSRRLGNTGDDEAWLGSCPDRLYKTREMLCCTIDERFVLLKSAASHQQNTVLFLHQIVYQKH